jgi:hypothetical protein
MMMNDRERVNWEEFKTIVNREAGLAIKIKKLPLRFPRFSYQIGCWKQGRDGEMQFFPYIQPDTMAKNYVVHLKPLNATALNVLIGEAEQIIHEEMQTAEDAAQVWRAQREEKQIGQQNEARKTGKTARKREQRRRREA